MKLRPLGTRVVIKPTEAEEKTAGGILIPGGAKETTAQGEVVAVGPGMKTYIEGKEHSVPVNAKVGDRVLYSAYEKNEVKIDGKKYLIIDDFSIIAVLEK